ncbi:MAG: TrkA C-terminal domain-containing protein [Syntrophotaleaceae bacterium]
MEELFVFTKIIELLRTQPVLTLFLILGMGYLIGAVRIGSFSLGPVAGVLFAGLFLGHFDFRMAPGAQAVGFALFIFSVGYQAGPRFFDVLRTDGLKYFLLALVIAVTGFAVATTATKLLALAPGTSAGLLAGGLTSSPTLAAAQEALRSGQVMPPEGISADAMIGNVATGYAITYIFGLAGLIAIIKLLPQVLGIDLEKEAKALESDAGTGAASSQANVSARSYRVTNEEMTKIPGDQLQKQYWDKTSVVKLIRNGEILKPKPEGFLQLGDELHILAPVVFFTETVAKFGEEITSETSTAQCTEPAKIVVINKEAVGKSLEELDVARKFGVLLARVSRMHMEIPRCADFKLRKGDILTVVGPHENVDLLGKELGHVERDIAETDMVTFAFGIALGVVIGLIAIKVGHLSIGLGSAGGLLSSGLAIGYLRSIRPTFGRLPDAARWILMEFGLLIFMAGVGLRAGGDIVETFISGGPILVLAGICVTVIPVFVGYFFGRKVLNIHPVLLFGGITGSMTSGASLSVVTKAANSSVPSLGYTGAYAFANVLLTVAGSVILFF